MPYPFIEQLRDDMRLRGYSLRTEKPYSGSIHHHFLRSNNPVKSPSIIQRRQ
ncbi:MAG: hypothetical protein JKX98_02040 [Alcanivoracaceae bacterium]|jgi:hypothetical protein|nr:hypothetical protein [Alcanivoracaceae bacterium]